VHGTNAIMVVAVLLMKIQALWDVTLCRLGVQLPTFRRIFLVPSLSWSSSEQNLLNLEDEDNRIARNVFKYSPKGCALPSRRTEFTFI